MIKRNVDNAIDAHFQKVTEMLREIMDKSPDPHLPEERERVISDLIERAFPNLGIVLLKDEEEFTHIASVVTYMDHGSYDSLLEDYPEKRRARP